MPGPLSLRSPRFVSFFAAAILGVFVAPSAVVGQSAADVQRSARVSSTVDAAVRSQLQGHVPSWATAANDRGSLSPDHRLTNLHLVLARAPQVEAAFQQLLADQQNPASPRYHKWLTPAQNAEQYGIAASDLAAVTSWLKSENLAVDDVASGGVFLTVSGRVSDLNRAFSVSLRNYAVGSEQRYGIADEPAVPLALSSVVQIVSGLSQHRMYRHSVARAVAYGTDSEGFHPATTATDGTTHYLAPADFNTIYDVAPVLNTGVNGTGEHAAVIIDSRISASDITSFDSFFGLPTSTVNQTLIANTGTDPGTGGDGEGEADLDVQRILGTAPATQVDLLVIGSLEDNYIESALQYNNTTANDPVLNMSFGGCTNGEPVSDFTAFDAYFSTGNSQGITYLASSGDNGAAACNANYNSIPAMQVLSTNYPCNSKYVTCVGGTEFNDPTSGTTYWSTTNNASTKASAQGYIPEGAWNEPTLTGTTPYIGLGTGGGVSQFSKPSWQTGNGVPADGVRDVPDVSFTASGHDGYLVCQVDDGGNCGTGSFKYVILGTSASSPSMAGVTVLLDEKLGSRAGNLNPLIYQLAATAPSAFHDTTLATSGVTSCTTSSPSMCNNSTPTSTTLTGGLAGYSLTAGYDLVTGWGSLDVNAFFTAATAATAPTFSVVPSSASLALNAGANTTDSIALSSVNSFAGTVALTCAVTTSSGNAAGSCSIAPTSEALTAGGTASPTLTVNASSGTSGTFNVTVTGVSGTTTVTSAAIAVTVTGPGFTVTPASTTLSVATASGATITDAITVTATGGFSGTVALTCAVTNSSGNAAGTCSLLPTSVSAASGGTASTLTVTPTTNTYGVLSVIVTGTSGSLVIPSATIGVTLNSPAAAYTLSASPASLSLSAGATSGNTDTITVSSVSGFSGNVALACAVALTNGGTASILPSCTLSSTSVAVTSGGTATSVATISTQASTTTCTTLNAAPDRPWEYKGGILLACLFMLLPLRKRKMFRPLLLALVGTTGLLIMSGCGGGGAVSAPSCTNHTVAGTTTGIYTVSITSGANMPSTSFSLTVN